MKKAQHEENSKILKELIQINSGLYKSFFNSINELYYANKDEKRKEGWYEELRKLGLIQPYEQFKKIIHPENISLPKESLEAAVSDVRELKRGAKGRINKYVSDALALYEAFIQALIETPDELIEKNMGIFKGLINLVYVCTMNNVLYINSPIENRCRGEIYNAHALLGKLKICKDTFEAIGESSQSIRNLESAIKSFESFLGMCKNCPYIEFGREKLKK